MSVCVWSQDDAGGSSMWETACGHAFEFTEDGPSDNGFYYCGYCGGDLIEIRSSDDVRGMLGEPESDPAIGKPVDAHPAIGSARKETTSV
jgi:hypothetical protein